MGSVFSVISSGYMVVVETEFEFQGKVSALCPIHVNFLSKVLFTLVAYSGKLIKLPLHFTTIYQCILGFMGPFWGAKLKY